MDVGDDKPEQFGELVELRHELYEAQAEIARHHRDLKKISDIVESAVRQHEFFKGNKFDQLRVIEPAIFEIRNIVG